MEKKIILIFIVINIYVRIKVGKKGEEYVYKY